MEFITREQFDKEPWRGRGHNTKVFRTVIEMEVGQILRIAPEDWGIRKYQPTQVVRYIEKKYKRKFRILRHAAGKGWAVERLS